MSFIGKNIQQWLVAALMIFLTAANVAPVEAQEAPPPDSPVAPGIIHGTGIFFSVTNSDWLNVTLNSTVPIQLSLTSSPKIITMHISAVSDATSTDITLGGLEANTTYWRYDDDSHSGVQFTADSSGNYNFTQNLTAPHTIRIQAGKSTYYIHDDGTGGDCALIGSWNSSTKTCTLTGNVADSIVLYSSGVTLDGAGFHVTLPQSGFVQIQGDHQFIKNLTIQGTVDSYNNPTGYGIYLYNASNSTVTDVTVLDTYWGVYSYASSNNTIQRSVFSGEYYGGYAYYADSNTISDNVFSAKTGGGYYGFYIFDAHSNTIRGNTFSAFSNGVFINGYYEAWDYYYYFAPNWYHYVGSADYSSGNNTVYRNSFMNISSPIYLANWASPPYYYNFSQYNQYGWYYYNTNGNVGNRFNLAAPDGGNYYSQFDTPADGCSDNNSDGFCDVAFTGPGAVDNLPWTTQSGWANQPPMINAGGPYNGNEGSAIAMSGASASDPNSADTLTYAWSVNSALCSFSSTTVLKPNLVCSDNGSFTVTLKVSDGVNPEVSSSASVTVSNVAPSATLGNNGPVNEGSNIVVSLTSPSDQSSADTTAGFQYSFDCGSGYGAYSGTNTASCPTNDNGTRAVKGKIKDKDGGEREYTTSVSVNNVAPVMGVITAPLAPVAVNTAINASASFTDVGTADTHTAQWSWGDASNSAGTVTESNGSGSVTNSHTYTTPGIYTLNLVVTDDDGAQGTSQFQYVVIYDPNGSFVTGGGWITSPLGAYVADPSLTGKANFGFVSKYQKGATVPTGNTQFQFTAGNLNFQSQNYQWLVVSGARAQFKGSGTINGSGNYGFLLSAIDGQVSGGGGSDKFRIKIWDNNNNGAVVYDNQIGAADDAAPTTVIGGGSIVIH